MGWETENVPDAKKNHMSFRDNSLYKWQNDKGVIGALEIPSEPAIHLRDKYEKLYVEKGSDRELKAKKRQALDAAVEHFESRLKRGFLEASENIPQETACCGLVYHDDATKESMVPLLNKGWVQHTNEKLVNEGKPFTVDVFLWQWRNIAGSSTTEIILIRFFDKSLKA